MRQMFSTISCVWRRKAFGASWNSTIWKNYRNKPMEAPPLFYRGDEFDWKIEIRHSPLGTYQFPFWWQMNSSFHKISIQHEHSWTSYFFDGRGSVLKFWMFPEGSPPLWDMMGAPGGGGCSQKFFSLVSMKNYLLQGFMGESGPFLVPEWHG